jgi:2-polyprenyl-3-methyl-5-hydroxy-6-metoxy-1,4-benzoquinol methylase
VPLQLTLKMVKTTVIKMEKSVKPIAIPGIHEKFYSYLKPILDKYNRPKILEIGSGHGAFTQKLWLDGYDVSASDLFPEIFYFDKLSCKKVDVTAELPYDANSFDLVIAVEVMEHIHDHEIFFRECQRILKKGGSLLFSTPNILSLKSRIRFLFSGFYYSFNSLDHARNDGLQHLASLTINQYENLGVRNKLKLSDIAIDKQQSTSVFYLFLYPIIRLYCSAKKINYKVHNRKNFLTGRILFMNFSKP